MTICEREQEEKDRLLYSISFWWIVSLAQTLGKANSVHMS